MDTPSFSRGQRCVPESMTEQAPGSHKQRLHLHDNQGTLKNKGEGFVQNFKFFHCHQDDYNCTSKKASNDWMATPTRRTWVWVNSRSWWWTGRPGMLQSMGSQRVGHSWATEMNYIWLSATPWTVAHQAPLSMELSRQEDWSGLPCPPPRDPPDPGIGPWSPALACGLFTTEPQGSPSPQVWSHRLWSLTFLIKTVRKAWFSFFLVLGFLGTLRFR